MDKMVDFMKTGVDPTRDSVDFNCQCSLSDISVSR